jgi:hypothetical protein
LALVIRNIIIFQKLFTHIEVTTLNLSLRLLNRVSDHLVFDGFTIFHAHVLHESANPIRRKDSHQVIFQRQIESGVARITLTSGATP